MPHSTFRQIKQIVDNQLLSHLTMDALKGISKRIDVARVGGAADQFPNEACASDEIDFVSKAISEELTLREHSAG